MRQPSQIEQLAKILLSELGDFVPEYIFHPIRKWRFDFCNLENMIAIECEGGTFSGGRHTRGKGFEEDCRKYCEATLLGWKVFRFTGNMVEDGTLTETIKKALDKQSSKR